MPIGPFAPCPLLGRLFIDRIDADTFELVDTTALERTRLTTTTTGAAELVFSAYGMQVWIGVLVVCLMFLFSALLT